MDPQTNNVIDYCAEYVANILSASPILSAVPILVENRRDIEFEIKNALGRQGIVGVVMCEKATFAGKYEDKSLAWQLDDLIVEFVENVSVNRYPPEKEFVTGQACGMEAFRCLCPLSGDYEGQFQPIDYQHGEDSSLIVTKCKFKCLAHLTGEYIPPPPRPGPIPVPSYDELISAVNEISANLSVVSGDIDILSADFTTLSSELSNLNERELMHYNQLTDQLSNCWKKTDSTISAGFAFKAGSRNQLEGQNTIDSEGMHLYSVEDEPYRWVSLGRQIHLTEIDPTTHIEFNERFIQYPSHSGTMATIEDISSYVPSVDLTNISCQNLTATQHLSATRADTGFLSAQGITIKDSSGVPTWFVYGTPSIVGENLYIQHIGQDEGGASYIFSPYRSGGVLATLNDLTYAEESYFNDQTGSIDLGNRHAVYCTITEDLAVTITNDSINDAYVTFNNLLSTDFTDIHLAQFGTIYIPEDENEEDILTVPAKSVKQFYITKIPETQSYALATRVLKSTSL